MGKTKQKAGRSKKVVELRLYIAGQTPKSLAAIANLKNICAGDFEQSYHIKVIDLLKNPALARDHQILAIPTLVRSLPVPICKIIGDLSDKERVIVGLDIRKPKAAKARAKASSAYDCPHVSRIGALLYMIYPIYADRCERHYFGLSH